MWEPDGIAGWIGTSGNGMVATSIRMVLVAPHSVRCRHHPLALAERAGMAIKATLSASPFLAQPSAAASRRVAHG